jgi:iron complex transport system substrate-binding protein
MMTRYKTLLAFLACAGAGLILSLIFQQLSRREHAVISARSSGAASAAPAGPQRILCMVPSATEAVFALGGGDRVIGVSDFCRFPPEASQKVRLGGAFNPNYERLLALTPDLLITQGVSEKLTAFCRQKNITLLQVQNNNIATIYLDILRIGQALGCSDRAVRLCAEMVEALDAVRARVRDLPCQGVFFCIGRTPGSLSGLSTIGPNSFISQPITVAGGRNIFPDVKEDYPLISKESLLQRQPDVIIEVYLGPELSAERREQLLADWQVLPNLPAVRTGRIYFPQQEFLIVPGPRLAQAADLLARLIHPEATHD